MDTRFVIYNLHYEGDIEKFSQYDPQLSALRDMPLAYHFPLLKELPTEIPGIYTLGGGRQIGKSTLLKQWMEYLMREKKVAPSQIFFFTGDIIDDYHQLLRLITDKLEQFSDSALSYLIVDEITYIKDWDKGIKFLADSGQLRNTVLMLSGFDLTMMQEARMRFPGRRGYAEKVDFHLYPLSFYEYLHLTERTLVSLVDSEETVLSPQEQETFLAKFNAYLQHGGYLTAINDIARFCKIHYATLATYSDWIRGDILKRYKQESYLKEICTGVIKYYASQISWNNLSKALSIEHHKTVADYMELLSRMDAVFIQSALQEDKLTAAPKKAKKIFFTDPFVFHAVFAWLNQDKEAYHSQILPAIQDPVRSSQLVETVVVNHFQRYYPTYYIKAESEIDVAYVDQNIFWPIELKWRNQIRPKELKQILKYKNAEIWSKTSNGYDDINGIKMQFLPLALARRFSPLAV